MKAQDFTARPAAIVCGDRDRQHGSKRANHERIAMMWTAWLSCRRDPVAPLAARDVAAMMALLKLSRMESGAFNEDDAVDGVGYLSILGELDWEDNHPAVEGQGRD
jgi:hypothetical protein